MKLSEWVPFSTCLQEFGENPLVLFPGVEVALKLLSENIRFPSVLFFNILFIFFNILFICVCVFRMLVSEAPVSLFELMFSAGLSHPEPLYDTRQPAAYLVRVLPLRAVLRWTTAPPAPTGKPWGIPGDSRFLPGLTLVAAVRGSEGPQGRKRGLEGCEGRAGESGVAWA